jgi:hypothetical protein
MPVLDAFAGNRHIWGGDIPQIPDLDIVVFVDRERGLRIPPDVLCDTTMLPFREGVFHASVADPPHHKFGSSPMWGDPKEQIASFYGNFKNLRALRVLIRGGGSEIHRVTQPGGLMFFKWCNISVHVNEVLPLLTHLWEVAEYTVRNTRSRRRPKNTYWVTLRRRDASTPLQAIPMLLREAP